MSPTAAENAKRNSVKDWEEQHLKIDWNHDGTITYQVEFGFRADGTFGALDRPVPKTDSGRPGGQLDLYWTLLVQHLGKRDIAPFPPR